MEKAEKSRKVEEMRKKRGEGVKRREEGMRETLLVNFSGVTTGSRKEQLHGSEQERKLS